MEYEGLGNELEGVYDKDIFFHQAFKNDEFLRVLVPPETDFFGTKTLNLFVASKPYGWRPTDEDPDKWHFDWGDSDSDYTAFVTSMQDQWAFVRYRFPYYLTWIYGDLGTAKRVVEACPGSDMLRMMNRTIQKLQEFCSVTPGFQYGGTIEDEVPSSYFQPRITEFYGTPKYKK